MNQLAKKFMKQFFIMSGCLLLACVILTIIFDPFFQYHKSLPGLKAVLTDKEYQCIGSLRTFDYDSVIVGSSVAENYNNGWFNDGFNSTSIKAIRSYGATADLCFLLDVAFEKHDLNYVFYNLDPSALVSDPETTFELTGCPTYLYDKNYFNDIEYLLNKGVLFEKIPYLLANSFMGDYDENNSYNWAQWKEFNSDMALGLYIRKPSVSDMKPADFYQEKLDANINLLIEQVSAHPETTFQIFIPPYSMLWWDNVYREGDTTAFLYNMEQAIASLLAYDNVEFYYFQNVREIITNLENYMDILHFSPEINRYICDSLVSGKHRVTVENYKEVLADMQDLSDEIVQELMIPYIDQIKVDLYE